MDPKIEIELNNTSKTYFPGEDVEGNVMIISNGSEYPISGIVLRMVGKRVAAINLENPEEFYFCEQQIILLDNEEVLPIDGMLEYPFHLKLPSELPSSFRVSRAYIEYHLSVTLKRKSDFDLTIKSPFYVNGVLKIENCDCSENHLKDDVAVEVRQSKSVGCFSCFNFRKSPRFGITAKLQKSHFHPGESIAFSLYIWNTSNSTLDKLRVCLVRELRILDSGNFHTVMKEYGILCTVHGPSIKSRQKVSWPSLDSDGENFDEGKCHLPIPEETPPTHLGCKKFIELNYFIKISIEPIGMCSSSLNVKIPIFILSNDHEMGTN